MGIAHEVEWKQLTLGHLSRNKFWGEDPDTQYHSVVASSTLVRDGDINILVDPTLPVDEMENRLQRYCGLDRNGIDIIRTTVLTRKNTLMRSCICLQNPFRMWQSCEKRAALSHRYS